MGQTIISISLDMGHKEVKVRTSICSLTNDREKEKGRLNFEC